MLTPYFIIECTALLCSLLLFADGVDRRFRIFIPYCWLVVINEAISNLLIVYWHHLSNHEVENLAILIFFSFYLFSCIIFVTSKFSKKLIMWLMVLFIFSWMINLIIDASAGKFYAYSFITGCILVSAAALLYLLEFLNNKSAAYPLKLPFFYIASAYLLYCMPLAMIFSIHTYFAYLKTPTVKYRYYFEIILNITNILMYLFFSIAFLIAWNQRKLLK